MIERDGCSMNFRPRFSVRSLRICPSKLLFFGLFVLLWLAQPVRSEGIFSFGDSLPSYRGDHYLTGLPSEFFVDQGETRFQTAGRVWGETIGGVEGVAQDLAYAAFFPFKEPVLFGAAALGIGLLIANDYEITAYYQDNIEPLFDWFTPPPILPRRGLLGNLSYEDQYLLAGLGLTYAYGLAFNDERAQVAAILSGKAITYSYLVSHVALKPVFGRLRPVPNLSDLNKSSTAVSPVGFTAHPHLWGNWIAPTLRPASYGTSFPSFHYTQYFAVARVYSGVYDNSWIPYLAAGVISVANIRGHRHWVADMAAGAVIGTVIGQSVLDSYVERRGGLDTSVMPILSTKSVGAQFTMRF